MNKMELTPEQIVKLNEMLSKLYSKDIIGIDNFLSNDNHLLFNSYHGDDGHRIIDIHWFEFCLTHLASKVIFVPGKSLYYCKDTYLRFTDNVMKTFFGDDKQVHPVDFLYTQFQKTLNPTK